MTEHVFRTPGQLRFGAGVVMRIGPVAAGIGSRALIVTGGASARRSGALARIETSLSAAGVAWVHGDAVGKEPTTADVDRLRQRAAEEACDVIISVGGGSALDAGKAAAGLYYSPANTSEHMADRATIPGRSLPWIAMPTTSGSGSEATPNAVLIDTETGIKKSLRSWHWLAQAALVDPRLTHTMPPSVTAYSGMDALVQAIESYTSTGANPLTEGISEQAAYMIGGSLRQAYEKGNDAEARAAVAWGSMMAGVALANARLGAVHGFAHPVGTYCGIAHGLACAILMPTVMEFNFSVASDKYARLARGLGIATDGTPVAVAARILLSFVRQLNNDLGIPSSLSAVGLRADHIPAIVEETLPSGSLAANPRPAGREDLTAMLRQHVG